MANVVEIPGYDFALARTFVEQLGVHEAVAALLVRRGVDSVTAAEELLEGEEWHEPARFEAMESALSAIRGAMAAGERISVHGDYDVDGVCATTILVTTLRELGAEVDWFIPDRNDGYGLAAETVEMLAERGTGLILTVDCGVASVEEVALAQDLGLTVVVTDHHRAGEILPDCPIVHPQIDSDYPYDYLCGAAVAGKVALALRDGADPRRDLDLVALATVADMVPLDGENRTLVRWGLAEIRRSRRPGLRALMSAAGLEPERADATDIGFKLAPRINAAGRLYRADAGVELFTCTDPARAAEIADELGRVNNERRGVERGVLADAEAEQRRLADGPSRGMVVAGEGWHPGVVGIVAARLVRSSGWPAVVVSLDAEGRGRASARSVPGLDLVDTLRECGDLLVKFGGHSAAAGLEVEGDKVEEFAGRFAAAVMAKLGDQPPPVRHVVDIVTGAGRLDLALATALESLGPFGMGNPAPRVLVPGARFESAKAIGSDGTHARFSLASAGGGSVGGVAFSVGEKFVGDVNGSRADALVQLEVNRFNGASTAQARLEERLDVWPTWTNAPGGLAAEMLPGDEEWERRFADELNQRDPVDTAETAAVDTGLPTCEIADREDPAALVADLAAGDNRVLVLAHDISQLATELAGVADSLAIRSLALAESLKGVEGAEVTGCDWELLAALAEDTTTGFSHVIAFEPPESARNLALAGRLLAPGTGSLHIDDSAQPRRRALDSLAERLPGRDQLIPFFRLVRDAAVDGPVAPLALRRLWEMQHTAASPEVMGRKARILIQSGLLAADGGNLGVVSSVKVDLSASPAYQVFGERREEALEFLNSRQAPKQRETNRYLSTAA